MTNGTVCLYIIPETKKTMYTVISTCMYHVYAYMYAYMYLVSTHDVIAGCIARSSCWIHCVQDFNRHCSDVLCMRRELDQTYPAKTPWPISQIRPCSRSRAGQTSGCHLVCAAPPATPRRLCSGHRTPRPLTRRGYVLGAPCRSRCNGSQTAGHRRSRVVGDPLGDVQKQQ